MRYLAKLKDPELLEPLLPSVRSNLDHRNTYVRRNALTALGSIYAFAPHLIPDAVDLTVALLAAEGDPSVKRNAFRLLSDHAADRAIEWLEGQLDSMGGFPDILQLAIVQFIRKLCKQQPEQRRRFLRPLWSLLQSSSLAVQFESAATLVSLTSASTTINAAASTFIQLLCKHSDNNVKMIVLDKLEAIKAKHPKVMEELVLDILRGLSSPDMDIRRKILAIALDLVTPRNIEQVILVLKKEIVRTHSGEGMEKPGRHRQMLIQAIHQCAVRFSSVASNVIHVLVEFLGDKNVSTALEVILFVREVVETYPDLREPIIRKVLSCFSQIQSPEVFRYSLWIVGEYATSAQDIATAVSTIKQVLGSDPFVDASTTSSSSSSSEENSSSNNANDPNKGAASKVPSVTAAAGASGPKARTPSTLADGTYAQQSAYQQSGSSSGSSEGSARVPAHKKTHPLRALTTENGGDFYLASVLCVALTKLAIRAKRFESIPVRARNQMTTEIMLTLTSLLRYAELVGGLRAENDCYDRMVVCLQVLLYPARQLEQYFLSDCHSSFVRLLASQQHRNKIEQEKQPKQISVQADDLIPLRQLRPKNDMGLGELTDPYDEVADLAKALGLDDKRSSDADFRLNRVFQLTGYSDPIYAEAFVNVHQYDIVLDVLVVNQTSDTLQNVSLELATLGDLKLCERPQSYTIGPRNSTTIRASIKVSSTETGVIFGNIVYDVAGTSSGDKNCVVLADIHIDIMDYIQPATCSEIVFQKMWASFEWENKVSVNTSISNVKHFLDHIVRTTNMRCLTPTSAMAGECGFLAANLYARSIFGEDALANIGIEKQDNGRIVGHIRIRSKTQGIALSLGERITLKQRTNEDQNPKYL